MRAPAIVKWAAVPTIGAAALALGFAPSAAVSAKASDGPARVQAAVVRP